jgi:hypothetical protein
MKKKDDPNVIEAFEKILKKMGVPDETYSDDGAEFTSKAFLTLRIYTHQRMQRWLSASIVL